MRIGRDPVLGDRLENTSMRNYQGAVGLGYIGDHTTAGTALKLYDFRYGLPVPPGDDPVEIRGRRYEGSGRLEWTLPSSRFPSVRAEGTIQDYAHDEADATSGAILQAFALGTRTVNLTLQQGRLGPFAEGAWGLSGLQKDYAATGPEALTPSALARSFGIFGFQELALTDGGPALQLGGRFDHYRIESRASERFGAAHANLYHALSGSVGLRLPLAEGISLGASYALSFRAPTVEELFSGAYHAGTGAFEFGDPGLSDERGRGLEGVLRVRSGTLNGQFAVYRNAIDHYIYLAARGDTILDGAAVEVLAYTQDHATLSGAEASLEWAATPTFIVLVMGDMIRAELRDGTPLSYIPPTRLGTELRWDNGTISLGATIHHEFRQDRVGPADERPTDAHTILRLATGIRRRIGSTTHSLTLRGDNLTNQLHREATSRIKDFAPNPGRNVSLLYRLYH